MMKKEETGNLIDSADTNVVIGTDTWLRLGIICKLNLVDQWTMYRSAMDQKGTFCRPSTLLIRLCSLYSE